MRERGRSEEPLWAKPVAFSLGSTEICFEAFDRNDSMFLSSRRLEVCFSPIRKLVLELLLSLVSREERITFWHGQASKTLSQTSICLLLLCRHFGTCFSRLRKPNCNRLLPTFYCLARTTTFQSTFLLFMHCFLYFLGCLLSITCHGRLPILSISKPA
jgi:hypothetical protein